MKNLNLLESKELREQNMGRIEVLDKVKEVLLIDELEMATVQMVADYYGVGIEAIKSQTKRNIDEFNSDGYKYMKKSEILSVHKEPLENVPNRGTGMYTKRAILRMGMVLRDGDIAKEVRTQLLNIVETVDDEVKVQEISKEKELLFAIVMSSGEVEKAVAIKNYKDYMERYKQQAEKYIEIYNSDKIYTATEIAKDLGVSATKLNKLLHNKGIQYKQGKSWHLYAKHEEKVPEYADYHITEFGQNLKWTNKGREWIMGLLKEDCNE